MTPVARIPLEGGGCVLVERPAGVSEGPVKAGRVGDAVREFPGTLQAALEPVTEAARAALDQLRRARPDEIAIEFGIDLAVEAGAVITKSQAGCHLKQSGKTTNELNGNSSLEAVEREHILRILRETNWVIGGVTGAAALLGLPRTTLNNKMQKLGISRPR